MAKITKEFLIRKGLHLGFGIIYLFLAYWLITEKNLQALLITTTGLLIIITVVEFCRVELGWFQFITPLMKKDEVRVTALQSALAVCVIAFAVFPKEIAFAAITISTIGDPVAAMIGSQWGKIKFKRTGKTWEGFLGFFLITTLAAWIFVPWPYAVGMALLGGLIELACSDVEDNFLVPLIPGFIAFLVTLL